MDLPALQWKFLRINNFIYYATKKKEGGRGILYVAKTYLYNMNGLPCPFLQTTPSALPCLWAILNPWQ